MSYTYLQEQGEESSAECFLDIPQYVLSRLSLTAEKSCSNGNETESCQSSQSGMMSAHLTEPHGEGRLMSSAEDSLAKTYLEQKLTTAEASSRQMGWMEKGLDCGAKCLESFARLDHDSCSWKMSQPCLIKELESFCETWPRWGMMHNGECYQLPPLVPRITAREYFWLLTPSASDGKKRFSFRSASLADRYRKHPKGNLAEQVSFLAQERGVMDGRLNPAFWDWMIGWPSGWTDLQPAEMHKFQRWQQQHLEL